MAIRVSCPECQAVASVEEQSLGRRGRCKKCGHVFALARPGGEAASAISGDASAWKGSASSPRRPAASPTNLPEQFGRYRIMKQLGQGGMGAVYLAHDTRLDRSVALKVPFFHPADGPQAVQRFDREARAAATLDHPNLCPVHDVGEIDGIHFLTMPYIEGKPFTEAIDRDRTVSEAQAAAVTRKLALALQEAHAKGVIHRDLKPANIMINRRKDLVIMDFGLARMVGGDDGALTRTGHVLGTALYMAPEQAAGDIAAIGPACDVYSLGVILFELLTGFRPFEGPWSLVIGLKTIKDPDPPSKHRPDLSPTLDAICLKAIAQKPEDRYATMAEFAEALGAFLTRTPSPAPVVPPSETSHPAESPESLAGQVFAGIITQEVTSLRGEKSPAQPKAVRANGTPPRFLSRARIIGAAGAAAILLLGVIIHIATNKGHIKIQVNDPETQAKIDASNLKPMLSSSETLDRNIMKANLIGWEKLFNGKDFQGWVPSRGSTNDWLIQNGILSDQGRSIGLLSERIFTNFTLEFEFQLEQDTGVSVDLWASPSETPLWVFLDVTRNAMGTVTFQRKGSDQFTVHRLNPSAELRPNGTWNSMRIDIRDNVICVTLNDRELSKENITWAINDNKQMLKTPAGRIGFQRRIGRGKAFFRNIMVQETKSEARADGTGGLPFSATVDVSQSLTNKPSRLPSRSAENGIPSDNPAQTSASPLLATAPIAPPPGPRIAAPESVINSLNMNLNLIPAGEFEMGSPDTDRYASNDEKPRHKVRITKFFYLSATEVTVGQFGRFVRESGYRTEAERNGKGAFGWDDAKVDFVLSKKYTWRSPGFSQSEDHPVVNVSWNDALKFCTWLGQKESQTYRLPTEAEWEYACRAGTSTRFWFGDDDVGLTMAGNLADGTLKEKYPSLPSITQKDDFLFTAPVGRFNPNAFGLYDTHGNVWEWCSDLYETGYYGQSPASDPAGPSSLQNGLRVIRGGSWHDYPGNFRSACHGKAMPDYRTGWLGFRVVREKPGQ